MGYKILATVSIILIIGVLIYTISRSAESPIPFSIALINLVLLLGQISALIDIWN